MAQQSTHDGAMDNSVTSDISRRLLRVAPVLALLLIFSCGRSFQYRTLPVYRKAIELDASGLVKLFRKNETELMSLPLLVPYVQVSFSKEWHGGFAHNAVILAEEAERLKADVVIAHESQPQYTGSIAIYWGWGISTSQPAYSVRFSGVCYRLSPVSLGFRTDDSGTVVIIEDREVREELGLLEGDRVLTIDATPYPTSHLPGAWMFLEKLLTSEPGQEFELIWLRPGEGRMSGKARFRENPPSHLATEDFFQRFGRAFKQDPSQE